MTEEQREVAERASNRNQELSSILAAMSRAVRNAVSHDDSLQYAYLLRVQEFKELGDAIGKFRNMIIRQKVVFPEEGGHFPAFGPVADLAVKTQTVADLEERLAFLGTWGSCDHVRIYPKGSDDYFEFCVFGPPIDGQPNRILTGGVKYYPTDREWQIHT